MSSPASIARILLALLVFTAAGWSLESTPTANAAAPPAAAVQAPQVEPPVAAQGSSGLPQRAPDPRTLEEYWPIFAAFVLTWIAIMGYFLTFGRRVSRIADELGEIVGSSRN
jgi:CcmD family protein